MLKEFRDFAVRGNVIDLAVGVIIGGAFGKIVDSVVRDLIMPVVGRLVGGLDFSNYFIALSPVPADYHGPMTLAELTKAGVPVLAYGNFLTVAFNFVLLAFIIFWMIRVLSRVKPTLDPAPSGPPPTPEDVVLLRQIRDLLQKDAAGK